VDVKAGKSHTEDAPGLVAVGGAWVLGKAGEEHVKPLSLERECDSLAKADRKAVVDPLGGIPGASIRVRIREGKIGLDIKDRRAVHKVCPRYVQARAVSGHLHGKEAHRGKPDGIRAEG
jgi:hypothetical protein